MTSSLLIVFRRESVHNKEWFILSRFLCFFITIVHFLENLKNYFGIKRVMYVYCLRFRISKSFNFGKTYYFLYEICALLFALLIRPCSETEFFLGGKRGQAP